MLLKERRDKAKRNFTQTLAKGQLFGYTENDELLLGSCLNEIDSTLCQQNLLFVEEKTRFTKEKYDTIKGHYMKMCDLRMTVERLIDEQTVDNKRLKKWIMLRSMDNDMLIINDRVMNEKKRVWSEVTRDSLSNFFHFETRKEETIRLSMYHVLFQYSDITFVVMSHLFRPSPLYYTEIEEKFDENEEMHIRGLCSTLALLSTCRYMYHIIGGHHYNNLLCDIKAKRICTECERVKSKTCDECVKNFCGPCTTHLYKCSYCDRRYCESCIEDHQMTVCMRCDTIFCDSCNDINDNGICGECRDETDTTDDDDDDMDIP